MEPFAELCSFQGLVGLYVMYLCDDFFPRDIIGAFQDEVDPSNNKIINNDNN